MCNQEEEFAMRIEQHPVDRRALAAFGVVLAVLLGLMPGIARSVSAQDSAEPRTLEVTGSGSASGTPDIAHVEMGIELTDADIGETVNQVNRITGQIVSALQEAGIAPEHIQTTRFSVYPGPYGGPYGAEMGSDAPPTYTVSNVVRVTVQDIGQVSAVIETALNAGANRVYNLLFGLSDPSALVEEARLAAVDEARANGEALAAAFGVTLGEPLHIREGSGAGVPLWESARLATGGGMGGPIINEGELSVSVQVQVVFALQP
jgi:hypothetical protein